MTMRQVLRQIRRDLAGTNYLSGPRVYDSPYGRVYVMNKKVAADRLLLGVFAAQTEDGKRSWRV